MGSSTITCRTREVHDRIGYNIVSAFAGNTLLISPDLLFEEALLYNKDLDSIPPFPEDNCTFSKVIRYKGKLLERAYQHFNRRGKGREPFEVFCSENSSWLENFSIFVVLKKHFGGKLWNQWPKKMRDRNLKSLKEIKKECHICPCKMCSALAGRLG